MADKKSIMLMCVAGMLSFKATAGDEITPHALNDNNKFIFDPALLKGSGFPVDDVAAYIARNQVKPGIYHMDVEVNGASVFQGDVEHVTRGEHVTACFTPEQTEKLGLKKTILDRALLKKQNCLAPGDIVENATVETRLNSMKVRLTIPDAFLAKHPRGYVAPEELTSGDTMGFVNYNVNQYYARYRHASQDHYRSTWVGLNNGVNLGLWRLRQQASWVNSNPGQSSWSTNRFYVQRAILPLRSDLLIGDSYTGGNFFSGMAYRGVSLASDNRMLPDSQRGYAPVVRGVANSNAKVTIRQGRSILYEATVPPGKFEINDLYATAYSGDLDVTVTEANGSANRFTVPFSAVPDSMRPGMFKYSTILARSRYVGDNNLFNENTWQYGLSNSTTVNAATRLADGYQAGMLGAVYSSAWGALGIDSTFSHARMPNETSAGWMLRLTYSKRFAPTNTTVSIAGYRYSTAGYRDLTDVLGVRAAAKRNNDGYISSTLNQSSRFEVSLNQSLGKAGNIWLSGSSQQYRDDRKRDMQYQLGYSTQFANGVSLNFSLARTRYTQQSWSNSGYDNYLNDIYASRRQTLSAVSISIPFGASRRNTLNTAINNQRGAGTTYQTGWTGVTDGTQPVSYGVSYAKQEGYRSTLGATAQTSTGFGSIQGSASHSSAYTQASGGIQGAIVAHKSGITAGPYVSDTFALVDARGASGAAVIGGQGAVVDRFGFALSPSVTPYRYNNVALDPANIPHNVELVEGGKRIAPYAGAMVRVTFRVNKGYPMLITLSPSATLPMGADVYNSNEIQVGMVGQGNQAWVRNDKLADTLTVKWGNGRSCRIHYKIKKIDSEKNIITLAEPCQ